MRSFNERNSDLPHKQWHHLQPNGSQNVRGSRRIHK